jgi:hypothetical protein
LLVLALARLLFPRRPLVAWAALGFFISCPVVLKTTAMFHPQPLAMFLAAVAFVLATRMTVQRRYEPTQWVALVATLAAAQLVRSVSVWVVGVVLIAVAATAVAQPEHRRRIRNALLITAAAAVLVPLPWYIHLQRSTSSAVLGRGIELLAFEDEWPASFYVSPGLPSVITEPHRAALAPRFLPLLYADTWGDYFGIWSWGTPRPELSAGVNRRLRLQSVVGLPLTALAVAGWVALLGLAVRRWRRAPALVILAVGPAAGLAAVLFYVTRGFSPDGDTVKAMFMLPAAPLWAVCFGFAADALFSRSRPVAVPILGALGVCGLVALSFATFASVS